MQVRGWRGFEALLLRGALWAEAQSEAKGTKQPQGNVEPLRNEYRVRPSDRIAQLIVLNVATRNDSWEGALVAERAQVHLVSPAKIC